MGDGGDQLEEHDTERVDSSAALAIGGKQREGHQHEHRCGEGSRQTLQQAEHACGSTEW
jgi:hypothetical protein